MRQRQSRTFTFVHASDSHIAPENVERFRHFHQLTDSLNASFILMGGDPAEIGGQKLTTHYHGPGPTEGR